MILLNTNNLFGESMFNGANNFCSNMGLWSLPYYLDHSAKNHFVISVLRLLIL